MNAPIHAEVINRVDTSPQVDLPLAAEGVLRYVYHGRFGSMLIEVNDGSVWVNGQVVVPADVLIPPQPSLGSSP